MRKIALLGERLVERRVQRPAPTRDRARTASRRSRARSSVQTGVLEVFDDDREHARRDREVVGRPRRAAELLRAALVKVAGSS